VALPATPPRIRRQAIKVLHRPHLLMYFCYPTRRRTEHRFSLNLMNLNEIIDIDSGVDRCIMAAKAVIAEALNVQAAL
jgi:protein subunit release factor A